MGVRLVGKSWTQAIRKRVACAVSREAPVDCLGHGVTGTKRFVGIGSRISTCLHEAAGFAR